MIDSQRQQLVGPPAAARQLASELGYCTLVPAPDLRLLLLLFLAAAPAPLVAPAPLAPAPLAAPAPPAPLLMVGLGLKKEDIFFCGSPSVGS